MSVDWIRHAKTIVAMVTMGIIFALMIRFPDVSAVLLIMFVATVVAVMLYALIYTLFDADDGDSHGV